MDKIKKSKKRKNNTPGTIVLLIATVICIVIGVFEVRRSFAKMNNAYIYSEKILDLFENSNKK